jgi:hypothetical protein
MTPVEASVTGDPPRRLFDVVDGEAHGIQYVRPEDLPGLSALTVAEALCGPMGGRRTESAVPVEDEKGATTVTGHVHMSYR